MLEILDFCDWKFFLYYYIKVVNKAWKAGESTFLEFLLEKLEKYSIFSSTWIEKLRKVFAETTVSVYIFHF